MKIHLDIANGYRDSRIAKIKLDNPNIDEIEAVIRFVNEVYGKWIKDNLGDDFEVVEVTENSFRIDFTYEDDANAFRSQIGGRPVEE